MVVLAASVVTKSGKALVSRQYMDMSRIRIEGLLAAFPKLVGTGKQHTYVETENVRYVYQPMEGLYLLLVTNKQSNILEDIDTLRLLSKIVPDTCQSSLEEEAICRYAFDLIFAFDEVISLGQKENITIQQVKQNCEMESHEEKLHKMIILSKINETKDVMKRKAVEIDKNKVERNRAADKFGGMGSAMPGMGNRSSDLDAAPSFSRPEPTPMAAPSKPSSKGPSKGMQLGKAKKANDFLETLAKEGEMMNVDVPAKASGPATTMPTSFADPVYLFVEEKLAVTLNKQGGLENLEVQGTLSLTVGTDDDAFVRVAVSTGENKGFQFKTHPNIDKQLYSNDNILGLKDPSRPFPTGSELGILKWRFQSKDEDLVPLNINCWPSVSGGESYVNIEYESSSRFDLQNVSIAIPLPRLSHAPTVNQVDGDWRYDARRSSLVWTIDLIDDTNRNGSMEFVVPSTDADAFYPVEVQFTASTTFCEVEIDSVVNTQKNAPIKYGYKRVLSTTTYQVA